MEYNEMTNLVPVDGRPNFVADLQSAVVSFCSFEAHTDEERKKKYTAMNNPDKRLAEMINMEIAVKDIYCETVNIINEKTGEVSPAARTVLIDEDGVSYQCVSVGVFNSIKKAISVFGLPTWENPIRFRVKNIPIKKIPNASTLTLEIV